MSAEREEGREGDGGADREAEREEGGGVSGLFKALVLCLPQSLEEGEAHMLLEIHTHTHTHIHVVEAATFSQPALQTDSGKRSLG